jgi:hypothetical protein
MAHRCRSVSGRLPGSFVFTFLKRGISRSLVWKSEEMSHLQTGSGLGRGRRKNVSFWLSVISNNETFWVTGRSDFCPGCHTSIFGLQCDEVSLQDLNTSRSLSQDLVTFDCRI